jgi:hypothetical protein
MKIRGEIGQGMTRNQRIKFYGIAAAVFVTMAPLILDQAPAIKASLKHTAAMSQIAVSPIALAKTRVVEPKPVPQKVATYKWMNADSWTPGSKDLYGAGTYRTDLMFTADSPLLPEMICPQIKADVPVLQIQNVGFSTLFKGCLSNPTSADLTIYVVTHGAPTRLDAALING